MASLVNRRTASLDDFCSRLGRYNRNLWTPVLRPRRNFRTPVSAARLHQTALQDQSHPAVCLGRVAAGLRRRVLETYACPTPANQNDEVANSDAGRRCGILAVPFLFVCTTRSSLAASVRTTSSPTRPAWLFMALS